MLLVSADVVSDQSQREMADTVKRSSNAFQAECYDNFPDLAVISNTAIECYGGKIVFVSHGGPSVLCGGISKIVYCRVNDLRLFDRQIIAIACYTAQQLGRMSVEFAYLYIGFDTAIGIPGQDFPALEEYIYLLSLLLAFFNNLQPGAVAVGEIEAFLRDFGETVDDTINTYERPDGTTLDSDGRICFRNLRDNLCVWIKGSANPFKYAGAPPLALLWF